MSNQQNSEPQDQNAERLKEIPKWTRRYAQNRMLTIPVLMVMGVLLIMFIAVLLALPLHLTAAGFKKGNMVLGFVGFALFVAALAAVLIFLIIFISKFCRKNSGLIEQLVEQRIYGKEGAVSMPGPKIMKKNIWLGIVIGVVLYICFFGSWHLATEGYIAFKYLQPISVFYIVPWLVSEYFQRRPRIGPLFLISPALYTIHAILIVAGVPLFFTTENFCIFNILLPLIGYTFLAYVIGHVYSRYALKKLKGITHLEGEAANGD
ncbi:MAG: hypothetical protein JSU70_08845 [Phycisphaerales bacterium]|nr:MAG: hypothetical protein JSU70_08845 [Phycisphaerales bacterium]